MAMDEEHAKPPIVEEAKALVAKVYFAVSFLTGMFSFGISALFKRDIITHLS